MPEDREFGPGLRSGGLYADLGVAEGTGGNFHAHIIKVNPQMHTTAGTTGMHRHDYDLQFNYMLSGEIDLVIEGIEEKLTFGAGDTYFLPHRILHNETRVSEDYRGIGALRASQVRDTSGRGGSREAVRCPKIGPTSGNQIRVTNV